MQNTLTVSEFKQLNGSFKDYKDEILLAFAIKFILGENTKVKRTQIPKMGREMLAMIQYTFQTGGFLQGLKEEYGDI